MELDVHAERLTICRLPPDASVPEWVDLTARPLVSVTVTASELSIVLTESNVPAGVQAETGWRALSVRGPLPFHLTGILASLAAALARAEIPIFAISTHDTDWLLVGHDQLDVACAALEADGHRIHAAAAPHSGTNASGATGSAG